MSVNHWKPGLPPGEITEGNKRWFLDSYDVYFSPAGAKWHRLKAEPMGHERDNEER